ncbi:phosphotransferase [Salibacterium salarium]|nr:phosphotransferase [Salibacterium salarium]
MDNNIEQVLYQYPIHPITLTRHGKAVKVEAAEGVFALKETYISQERAERFLQTLRFFEKQQLPAVTPVLPTENGEWSVEQEGKIYYLSPWGESCGGKRKETDFFKTLAVFHRSTDKKIAIRSQEWQENGEKMRRERDQELLELEVLADEIEKKRYFSPFELSYLSHFPLIYDMYQRSMSFFDEWERKAEERRTIRLVQCHGSPSPHHLITDPKLNYRFINLEQTKVGHPAHDVAWMYKSCMEERCWEPVKGYSWMQTYDQHFPFNEADKALVKSQIFYPGPLSAFIKDTRHRELYEEPYLTQALEQHVWLFEKIKKDMETWSEINKD